MTVIGNKQTLVRTAVWVGIVALLVIFWFTGALATVKPIGQAQSLAAVMGGGHAFDKVRYVDSIWQSRVLPTVRDTSVDLGTLVSALEKDPKKATKEYGHDVGGAYNFLVHFSGIVTKVDTSSPRGSIIVNTRYPGGDLAVNIQVGPVILGTSLRDALKFISFGQFLNQMQYGSVADELNNRVEQNVVSKLDLKTLTGKRLDIRGAFTYDGTNAKDVVVTPVLVTVQ
ncbi:MAG TPA: DUF2291 domain-containing protein [Spirochaetia bacterium]|nr:DUF2291 domain-containing protein [Spirochaetia bacterium]